MSEAKDGWTGTLTVTYGDGGVHGCLGCRRVGTPAEIAEHVLTCPQHPIGRLTAERDAALDELTAERSRNQPLRQRIKESQDQADRAVKEAQRAAWEHWSQLFRPLNEAMETERKLEKAEAEVARLLALNAAVAGENGRLREALKVAVMTLAGYGEHSVAMQLLEADRQPPADDGAGETEG